ncbi:ScaI family restriction endonuclease [Saccharothrix obliqua]|uniref:ScaI family restriction endonuclease n=1 Tax=Saccharothrix obliqua TaxID=2861747 RepID=UPI001C5D9F32|nr:ScaI family restriction endonuclease [Saccharothrix obliqua]MBW4715762.1 ScaI family restriction endonuclease [Saccharothrix obliqua]
MSSRDWPDWVREARVGGRTSKVAGRPKLEGSPYYEQPLDKWVDITRSLLAEHPLSGPVLVDVVLRSWSAIFESRLGSGFYIGQEIKPAPQVMGFFLHSLIPLELARGSGDWRAEITAADKDLVHIPDDRYSLEIKTSSHPSQVFGNRSYGVDNPGRGKKAKDGYYVAVNFEKWPPVESGRRPEVKLIRFGWLDRTDWVAQKSETGQQSAIAAEADNRQLLTIYEAGRERSEEVLF